MASMGIPVSKFSKLRKEFSRFLANDSPWKASLRRSLKTLKDHKWPSVVFGGVLRDLSILGPSELPRDVDVVVSGVSPSDLEEAFKDIVQEKNRFGGLRLRAGGWLIDIWSLHDTWAFREGYIAEVSFDSLVKTTFLNVEAAAIDVFAPPGKRREIYTHGFAEAIDSGVVDINFEPNPYPALCLIRSIFTAIRLRFRLSFNLAKYISRFSQDLPIEQLMRIQETHYGVVRIQQERMREYLQSIDTQLRSKDVGPIELPSTRAEQLLLSQYSPPAC